MGISGKSASIQAGTVAYFAAAANPSGFLECNGAAISRTAYAALFAAIGTAYGVGDGSTTFNVPDLRGEFIRGHDNGRGVDSGRAIATAQTSQNLSHNHGGLDGAAGSHNHTLPPVGGYPSGSAYYVSGSDSGSGSATTSTVANHQHSISADGGSEARPRNIAMRACIKF